MDIDLIIKYLGLVGGILGIPNMLWILINRGTKDFTEKLEKHETKLTDHDRRIQRSEDKIEHLPTSGEVADLRLAITRVEGHIGKMETAVEAITHTSRRIETFILESEK